MPTLYWLFRLQTEDEVENRQIAGGPGDQLQDNTNNNPEDATGQQTFPTIQTEEERTPKDLRKELVSFHYSTVFQKSFVFIK